jgi:hypothetical protein
LCRPVSRAGLANPMARCAMGPEEAAARQTNGIPAVAPQLHRSPQTTGGTSLVKWSVA